MGNATVFITGYIRNATIAYYKIPQNVMFGADFPVGATDKIQKFTIREESIKALRLEAAEKIETALSFRLTMSLEGRREKAHSRVTDR